MQTAICGRFPEVRSWVVPDHHNRTCCREMAREGLGHEKSR